MLAFWIITCVTALLVLTSLLPRLNKTIWWVRVWDFPRLQQTAVALLLLIASAVFLPANQLSTWLLIAAQLACGAWQFWWIFPYTPFAQRTVKRYKRKRDEANVDEHIRLLTVNVLEPNRRAVELTQIINNHRPDVIVAVETDEWWEQQFRDIEDDLPHVIRKPQNNLYGMMVYSTENEKSKQRDNELMLVAGQAKRENGPVIVTGDLNDVAWSKSTRAFIEESQLLDPRMGRGIYNTFHAKIPIMRWPLDHVFHSNHFMLVELKRLPPFGSDHFALLTELALKSEN
jgi:endonuclease/exonuclease/phosphatase (EEP) superfamily protein YafD